MEYKGNLVRWKDVEYEDPANGYLMYITAKAVIDARPSKTFGRYANDAGGYSKAKELSNNAEYVSVGVKCYIEAIRDIEPGEEIFVDYGKDYWDLDKKTKRAEKRKKNKSSRSGKKKN